MSTKKRAKRERSVRSLRCVGHRPLMLVFQFLLEPDAARAAGCDTAMLRAACASRRRWPWSRVTAFSACLKPFHELVVVFEEHHGVCSSRTPTDLAPIGTSALVHLAFFFAARFPRFNGYAVQSGRDTQDEHNVIAFRAYDGRTLRAVACPRYDADGQRMRALSHAREWPLVAEMRPGEEARMLPEADHARYELRAHKCEPAAIAA